MKPESPPEDPHRRMAGWMVVGMWLLIFGLLTLFFQNWLDKERNPNQRVDSAVTDAGVREVTLQRNRYGHYNVSGRINGHPVEFMLDTGATLIAVPLGVAQKLGLQRLYETQFQTANGLATGYGTKLDEVRIGDIALSNLRATITPNMDGDIVLLGMSFLKRIEFTQHGDSLTLRQYPGPGR